MNKVVFVLSVIVGGLLASFYIGTKDISLKTVQIGIDKMEMVCSNYGGVDTFTLFGDVKCKDGTNFSTDVNF